MNKTPLQLAISELWQISRTALAGQYGVMPSRYDRMQYVKKELYRTYPSRIDGMNAKQVWIAIEEQVIP